MQVLKKVSLAVLTIALALPALAQTNSISTTAETSNRMGKKLGATIGVMSDPYPSLFGMNVSYNLTDYLRPTIGYGSAGILGATITTVGLGVTGFVPGWNFTPTAGLHYSNVSASDPAVELQGFQGSGDSIYASLGIDWQTGGGFNLATGYNIPVSGKGVGTLYVSAGWFFNVN